MAYTFTVTEVTPNIGLTVTPAANFTVTNAVNSLAIAETNPQFTVTDVPDNAITINDDGYVFTLTNVDSLVTLTNAPAFVVTATNAVQSFNLTQNTNNFNFSATNITFTATTAIGQIQTENMATIFKGEFTSTAEVIYYRGHIVRHNQNIYVANVEPSERVTNPAAPPGNDQWRLIFSQTGLQGWQVTAMEKAYNQGPWNSGATYALYTWVEYAGYIWELINQNGSYNSEPTRANANWKQVGSQGDQALFTTSSVQFNNLNLSGNFTAVNGVVSNFTVTNRLTAGGMRYPITHGTYGQVLATNGVNEANWVDASGLTATNIRAATRENIGGVIIGTGLNVTAGGVISITTGTNGANIGWNLTDDLTTNGFGIYTGTPDPINENFPVPRLEIGSGERNAVDASLLFESRSSSTSVVKLVGDTVRIGSGNPTFNTINYEVRVSTTGTNISGPVTFSGGALNLNPLNYDVYIGNTATLYGTSTTKVYIGGSIYAAPRPYIGSRIDILSRVTFKEGIYGEGSVLPVKVPAGIQFADGSIQTTNAGYRLTTATSTVLGGIKVGSSLIMDLATGILDVPLATTTSSGLIRVGSGLSIGYNGVLSVTAVPASVPLATTTSTGVIQIGNPFYMNGNILSINTATTSSFGVIKVGNGLGIDGEGRLYTNTNTGTNAVYADGQHGIEIVGTEVRLKLATTSTLGGVMISGDHGLYLIGSDLALRMANTVDLGGVRVGYGLSANQYTGVLSVNPANGDTFGGIILGAGLAIDGNGKTYVTAFGSTSTTSTVSIIAGQGLTLNSSTNIISLNTATANALGGIKVGQNLSIDANGVLNAVGTFTNITGQFNLGSNSYTNGYTISYSTSTSAGGEVDVNIDNVAISAGYTNARNIISVDNYGITLDSYGTGQLVVGDNGVRIDGVGTSSTFSSSQINLNANSAVNLNAGDFKLRMTNNTARIYTNLTNESAKLVLEPGESTLQADDTLTLTAPTLMKLQSPFIQMGSLYDSRLYVGTIQNFSGTGPPLLADGVQYGDLSVQRTAWPGYDYGQIIRGAAYGPNVPLDFNNTSLAVDFNR